MERKKLPAGVTFRKDGRYMGRVQIDNERYTLYDTDLDNLLKRLEDLRYELRHGIYEKEQNIVVNVWFHTWMEEYKKNQVRPTTYDLYERTYELHIKKYIGNRKMKDIRPEHIQRLLNKESTKVKKQTLSRINVILNGFFKQAYKNGIIRKNPVERTNFPKMTEEVKRRVMTMEEQKIFLEYANKKFYGNIFEVALATGMRSGELRALEWKDVDFDNRVIHVTGTLIYTEHKYKKGPPKSRTSKRDIPMLDNVYRILKEHRHEQLKKKMYLGSEWKPSEGLEELVFTTTFGRPLNMTSIQYYIRHIQEMIWKDGIEFPPIHMHTLRHTFATRCIENGMQPQVLKTILGHSSLAMTMDLYSHVLPDVKADEMQKIAGLF